MSVLDLKNEMQKTIDEIVTFYKIMRINNNHFKFLLEYTEGDDFHYMERFVMDYAELFCVDRGEIETFSIEGIIELYKYAEYYLEQGTNSSDLVIKILPKGSPEIKINDNSIDVSYPDLDSRTTFGLPKTIKQTIEVYNEIQQFDIILRIIKESKKHR